MLKSSIYPSIEEIIFRVALEYENFYRGNDSQLKGDFDSDKKRMSLVLKKGVSYCINGEVIIYLVIGDYIMQYGTESYFFNGVPIGRGFQMRDNLIAFTGKPRVLKKEHHHHPFVFSDNEICFNGDERWTNPSRPDLNILWNHWYDTTKKSTVEKITKWLEEGRFVIQQGYKSAGGNVHDLNRDNFPAEYRTYKQTILSGVPIFQQGR